MQPRRKLLLSRCASIACIVAFSVFAASHAAATPLNLSSTHPGDITTSYTAVSYTLDANPATGTLSAIGYPGLFDDGLQGFITSYFDLNMTVDRSTGAVIGGTVTITGETDGTPYYNGTLLTGDIIQFGFADGPFGSPTEGNIFEFIIDVTGGLLEVPYYSTGFGGIIMNIQNQTGSPTFNGVFTSAFQNDGFSGFSDTFPTEDPLIPEPSTFVLLGLGILPLAWRLRRRGRR